MTRTIILSLALLVTLNLSACNTVDGVGRDISGASRSVQDKM